MTFTKFNEFSYASTAVLCNKMPSTSKFCRFFRGFFYLVCGSPCYIPSSYILSRKINKIGNIIIIIYIIMSLHTALSTTVCHDQRAGPIGPN